jgi:hypothetical protein
VGTKSALTKCAGRRYLMKLLSCSGAAVAVLVGRMTLNYWNSLSLGLPNIRDREGTNFQEMAGRKRLFVFSLTLPDRSRSHLPTGFPWTRLTISVRFFVTIGSGCAASGEYLPLTFREIPEADESESVVRCCANATGHRHGENRHCCARDEWRGP